MEINYQMSGLREVDIGISQCSNKLYNFRSEMTGQNGQISEEKPLK